MKLTSPIRLAVIAASAVVAAAAIALLLRPAPASHRSRIVIVDLEVTAGGTAQLFWSGDMTFSTERSADAPLQPGAPQRLRFLIPRRGVRWLRLDPTDAAGLIVVRGLQIVDERGPLLDVPPMSLRPVNQVASIAPDGSAARIETTPAANDPYLYAAVGCIDPPSMAVVTPRRLIAVSALAAALVAAAAVVIARTGGAATLPWPRGTWVWLGALMVVTFAAKLLLMRATPVLTPFWDQWDSEAAFVFAPFDGCSLTWQTMFAFHNEHRIFFSRLLALDLLSLNGQWDPRLEQVVNALIHAGTGVLLAVMLWLAGGRRRIDLVVVVVALGFGLPFSWENTLAGFQSAFYLLLLFSLLAVWLTTTSAVGTLSWCLGWLCALSAVFTAASGLLAAVTIGGMTVLRLASGFERPRSAAANLSLAVGVFGVGLAVASPPLPHHEVYRVKTAWEFGTALARSMAWPRIFEPQVAVLTWLPIAVLVFGALRRRLRTTPLEQITLGLGAWVLMHAVALAYGRGAGGALPAGRYMDFLSLGFITNTMALTSLLDRTRQRTVGRKTVVVAMTAWLVFAAVGLNDLVSRAGADLNIWRQYYAAHTEHVRRFVMTGDAAALRARVPLMELPYPVPERLVQLLQDPYILRILPAAVRRPIQLEPHAISPESFARNGIHASAPPDPLVESWGSFTASGNAAQGRFESRPLRCTLGGRLRFDVAGHLGLDAAHSLAVRGENGATVPVSRSATVRNGWSDALVDCPDGPFSVIATDESRWSWFAFRPPVEMGSASVAAERVIDAAWPLFLSGLILVGLAARWA